MSWEQTLNNSKMRMRRESALERRERDIAKYKDILDKDPKDKDIRRKLGIARKDAQNTESKLRG